MVQVGHGAGLRQVRLRVFRAGYEPGVRHFDRYPPVKLFIVGQKDEAKSSLAQQKLNLVAPDPGWKTRRRGISRRGLV